MDALSRPNNYHLGSLVNVIHELYLWSSLYEIAGSVNALARSDIHAEEKGGYMKSPSDIIDESILNDYVNVSLIKTQNINLINVRTYLSQLY